MGSNQIVFRILIMAVCMCVVPALTSTTAHSAPVPVLIRDINTTIKDNSGIGNLHAAGSTLYFTAWDRAHARELWKSDGTAAGTAMVKDINVGEGGGASSTNYMVNLNGYVYFTSAHATYNWSFWRSDGTDAGTVLVKDHFDASDTTVMNGKIYMTQNGSGIWQYDPASGIVTEIYGALSAVTDLTPAGNILYFKAGNDLWRSDGTEAGTFALTSTEVYPVRLTAVGATLFFRGWTDAAGYELWRSGGTPETTGMVEDMIPGDDSGNPEYLTEMNGTLYFSATDDIHGHGLWKCTTTGTPSGVELGISLIDLVNVNGVLYFRDGGDLWKSNGIDDAGTLLVKESVSPDMLTNVNGTLFFQGWSDAEHWELWRSNGTAAGTFMVKDINPGAGESRPNLLTNVNGTLFFVATEPSTGTQLWKSDGTAAGTVLVRNVSPGSKDATPDYLTNVNGTLYFNASDEILGKELWQSNGTLAGTSMVQDLAAGYNSSDPKQITDANGTIYFVANSNELWKRVGTGNAVQVKDLVSPDKLTYVNGLTLLFFEGWSNASGDELWKSDGTEAGTVVVKDIRPGSSGSGINSLTSFNNLLYFIATEGVNGAQLWKSDGTADGTVIVRSDIRAVESLTRVGNKLFFVGDSYSGATKINDNSLWVIDGASGPTEIMTGIWPEDLTAVGATLFFQGNNSYGTELWKSDGSQAGTVLVKDIHVGGPANPENLTNVNGTLYFTVWNTWGNPDAMEIWKSNGTEAGTVLVKSLVTTWDGYVSLLTSVHGLLAFTFEDAVNGKELWTSDGTTTGTTMVKDLYPDPSGFGSSPDNLTMAVTGTNVLNEALFFSAIDEIAGNELYILDFTPPESTITAPADTAHIRGTTVTITGTSSDSMPGTGVNLVQVSMDGVNWHTATDTSGNGTWSTWQYVWTLPVDGVYTIRSRSTDLATNLQSPLASITVTVDNTKPVVTLSAPAVFHPASLPSSMLVTYSATDLNGITSYCLTPSVCLPNSHQPTSFTFHSEGNTTLLAWAQDPAGNVSNQASAAVLVALPHSLTIDLAGNGGGSVFFTQKNASYNVDTTVTAYSYDQVDLQATPAEYSLFGGWSFNGWSGECAGANCSFIVPTVAGGGATQTATATFTYDSGHAVMVGERYFSSILGAYQADTTVNGNEIRMFGTTFDETLLLDRGKVVTLTGGDHQNHTPDSNGMTSVPGPLTVQSGMVTMGRITIR